ncbi:probable glucosamine 6-phosphate N-acetyltransferase [Tetranychus urticae]|uniref:probable glucosamine 6-phosphate N-acetyltransferase n=1 Tax=Tetranychus urticae TaxID=32264 RepID=UPI00077BF2E4|nr:probable glucosamine 6-phosphate N-acetyltransferase [Tetranychus urticae]XP_015793643.1 probable glucosamine 6-phosphate N-acetyltransferase [Tetranychus urticae]XP_015793644.1 probable glucosamine 6-phosphate N-acetyltransferase [Tetranychus urticae]
MCSLNEDSFVFSPSEIESLDWSVQSDWKDKLESLSLKIRPLQIDDYDRGFTKLLGQLTHVGDVTKEEFEERFKLMRETKLVRVVVIEDSNNNQIAGTATLLCEPKFIHQCSWIGHVQDVCVDEAYRGKGLGKIIVNCLKLLAQQVGAYKVDLNCSDAKIGFYSALGFKKEDGQANYMTCRYKN